MPSEIWLHRCCAASPPTSSFPICPHCGSMGTYQALKLSLVEKMCAYAVRFGLKPVGLHRPFADQIMLPLVERCPRCHGVGVLGMPGTRSVRCPVCDMGCSIPKVSDEEFQLARQTVITCYPKAATPGWRPLSERTGGRKVM